VKTEIPVLSRSQSIPLDLVDRDPGQPRQTFDEDFIIDLSKSILQNGLINDIYVRLNSKKPGRYLIVAGEQRFRALKLLEVEAWDFKVVEKQLPPYIISIIENELRRDLNPIERAESYRECMDREGMSMQELSAYTGKHQTEISRFLRFLKLPEEVQQMIRENKLTQGNAQHLYQFKNLSRQIELAQRLVRGEDPPEITEAATNVTERSEQAMIARLPKTADGLIRRMLEFRRRAFAATAAMDKFLELPAEQQTAGWQEFSESTRANFTKQLGEIIGTFQAVEQKMIALPGTKRKAWGRGLARGVAAAAAASPPEPVDLGGIDLDEDEFDIKDELRKPPDPRTVPPRALGIVRRSASKPTPPAPPAAPTPPIAAPTPAPIQRSPIVANGAVAPESHLSIVSEGKASAERSSQIFGLLFCNASRHDEINLSASRLRAAMALSIDVDVQAVALGILRTAWASWNLEPKNYQNGPHRKFIERVVSIRESLGDTFLKAMNAAWLKDQSKDPIDLGRLFSGKR
jgi:ParB family chromosome partitioning protein